MTVFMSFAAIIKEQLSGANFLFCAGALLPVTSLYQQGYMVMFMTMPALVCLFIVGGLAHYDTFLPE